MEQPMPDQYTPDQLEFLLQFDHPEKILAGMPGVSEAIYAQLFAIDEAVYREIKGVFLHNAKAAAAELLTDAAFAQRIERLPFKPGAKVVGLGDSITDDYQSWLEILRHVLAQRRPQDDFRVINAGVSGDTTSQIISRFLDVAQMEPDWIICMAGTNDARRHGLAPTKVLVSVEETAKNLAMLRSFAATQTSARWVWMTPTPVIEEKIASHWYLSSFQVTWTNEELTAIGDVVRSQTDPVVNLQAAFGSPAAPELLLPDGLHPSLAGQKRIVQALVETLTA